MEQLSPEDRQRIYLEEKARLEIREQIQREKKGGSIFGGIAIVVFAILIALFAIGSTLQKNESDRASRLTPTEKRVEFAKKCAEYRQLWENKTYAEMSEAQRAMKDRCDHPEAE